MLLIPPPRPNPAPPNVGRSLAQAVNAAWYWAGIVGRVKPPAGTEPLGVVVADPPGVVVDEPVPERPRRPNSEPASLAGTPLLSRHEVYFARLAATEPEGAVVVGDAVVVLELPPQAASRVERARTGRAISAQRMGEGLVRADEWFTIRVNLTDMKVVSEKDKSSIRTESGAPAGPARPSVLSQLSESGARHASPFAQLDRPTRLETSVRILVPGAARHPLVRRITGYSAGSVVAATVAELTFVVTFGWVHAGTTWATAAGFVGGAVPNYILNRRWAWPDRRGRRRRTELLLYTTVILISFVASALATHWVQVGAGDVSSDGGWQTVLVAAAFLAVSGLFFVIKFALYELVVFTPGGTTSPAD